MIKRMVMRVSLLVIVSLLCASIIYAQNHDNICPHCNQAVAADKWDTWSFAGGEIPAGHYYLDKGYTAQSTTIKIPDNVDVCLDLKGNEYFAQNIQPFEIYGTLTIIDTENNGRFYTTGANNINGGFASVKSTGTLNIKSGTIRRIVHSDISICSGGLVQVDGGVVNISGGMLIGGVVKDNGTTNARGGNIALNNGSMNLTGGTITGGMAYGTGAVRVQGGNIYIGGNAEVTVSGGTVADGYSDEDGGNIFISGTRLTMTGGSITGGHAVRHGGNISQSNESVNNSSSFLGGAITGGVAGGKLNTNNNGTGSGGGGNYYAYSANGALTISNCTISGDIKIDKIKSVTLSGVTKIGLGKSNGFYLPIGTKMDVSGLLDGSEVFICAFDVFTTPIPSSDSDRIFGYFKGAVRTCIALDNNTLIGIQGETGYCPHCYDPSAPKTVTWYDIGFTPTAGKLHCYMKSSDVSTGNRTVTEDIVLDLNGYTYYREASRIIMFTAGKSLTILDTYGGGRVKGEGSDAAQNANGAVIQYAAKANVTIYSGTLTMELKNGECAVPKGGIINANAGGSTLSINGGIISGGMAIGEGGGNIHMNTGTTLTMRAGIVKNGAASGTSGGNLYCSGSADIYGGFIVSGSASNGGNVYATGDFNLIGGTISAGDATANGGNIYGSKPNAKIELSGGTVSLGTANDAGNMYCDATAQFTGTAMIGGEGRFGGNVFVGGGTINISNGIFIGGKATSKGGNIYSSSTATRVNISGGIITSGTAPAGGNICVNNGALNISENALVMNGASTSTGGNIHVGAGEGVGSATATLSGGTVTGGISDSGGNIFNVQITNLSGASVTNGQARNGGNICIGGGTVNMSSGTVSGGFATERGGNIYQSGKHGNMSLTGGIITDGQAVSTVSYETSGGNISIANGSLKITGGTVSNGFAHSGGNIHLGFFNNSTATIGGTGNPVITGGTAYGGCGGNISYMDMAHQTDDDDYIPRESEAWLVLDKCIIQKGNACNFGHNIYVYKNAHFRVLDSYEGSASVFFHYNQLPSENPYGAMLNTDCITASGEYTGTLIMENYDDLPYVFHKDGHLQVASAALVKNDTFTWYQDNADLVENYGNSDYMRPRAGELILTGGTYTIDLAGQSLNITGTGEVYGLDSGNDTYKTAGNAVFGSGITLAGIKTAIGDKTYFALQDGNTYSFHRGSLDITSVSLRASNAGLYYTAQWQCDEALAKQIQNFGVVVSLAGDPGDDFTAKYDCLYTCQKNFEDGTTANGVLVSGILKTDRIELNSDYAQKPIYAAAYITLNGNEYTGTTQSHSLHSLLQLLSNEIYTYYPHAEKLQRFMDKWHDFGLSGSLWNLDFEVPEEIAMLGNVYTGTNAYHGELHDHADTGGNSDGNNTLAQWLAGIKKLDMDFATILDHRQDRHMHLDDWDETWFIGGSEIGIGITDLKDATRAWLHSNMIFADWRDFRAAIEEFDSIAPGGGFRHEEGEDGAWYMTNLQRFSDSVDCRITKAQMAQWIEIVRKNNGMFVHPHAKLTNCVVSDNIEDYWFADWTGLEVLYTYKSHPNISPDYITANYKLWVDLLSSGKKIWATAGNDEHAMASNKALTTVYATEKHANAFMDKIANGNFTAGPVGIKMAIGNGKTAIAMGGECDFTGMNLALSVGDYHSSIVSEISDYKIILYADENVVKQWCAEDGNDLYYYQEADPAVHYYRVEIRNVKNNAIVALGNPIWNTAA